MPFTMLSFGRSGEKVDVEQKILSKVPGLVSEFVHWYLELDVDELTSSVEQQNPAYVRSLLVKSEQGVLAQLDRLITFEQTPSFKEKLLAKIREEAVAQLSIHKMVQRFEIDIPSFIEMAPQDQESAASDA
jgi:hypothetical protein